MSDNDYVYIEDIDIYEFLPPEDIDRLSDTILGLDDDGLFRFTNSIREFEDCSSSILLIIMALNRHNDKSREAFHKLEVYLEKRKLIDDELERIYAK